MRVADMNWQDIETAAKLVREKASETDLILVEGV